MSDLTAENRYLAIIIAGLCQQSDSGFIDRDPQWLGRLAGLSTRKTNALLQALQQTGRIELTRDCVSFAGFSLRKTPFFPAEKREKNTRNFSGTTAEIRQFSRARARGDSNLDTSETENLEGGDLRAQAELFFRNEGMTGDDFQRHWDAHCDEAIRYRWDDARFAAAWRQRVRSAAERKKRGRQDYHGTPSARQRRSGLGLVEAAAGMLDQLSNDGEFDGG